MLVTSRMENNQIHKAGAPVRMPATLQSPDANPSETFEGPALLQAFQPPQTKFIGDVSGLMRTHQPVLIAGATPGAGAVGAMMLHEWAAMERKPVLQIELGHGETAAEVKACVSQGLEQGDWVVLNGVDKSSWQVRDSLEEIAVRNEATNGQVFAISHQDDFQLFGFPRVDV